MGWAIAVGALSVALVVAIGVSVFGWISYRQMLANLSMYGPTTVTVSPVDAGEPWFEVSGDQGTLEGWSYGSYGSDDLGSYSFDVFDVGSYEGVPVQHVVTVYADEDTEFYFGDEAYKASDLEAIFGMESDPERDFLSGDMRLRIDFHVEGGRVRADRVTALPGSASSPLFY